MEAFEIHFEITKEDGQRVKFSKKEFAATGWEARVKVHGAIYRFVPGVQSVRFLRWKVLNPFAFHFPEWLQSKEG
jgi:hypothetical protein